MRHTPSKQGPRIPGQPDPNSTKKRRKWLYVIGAILVIGIVGNLINPNSSNSAPTATLTPTLSPEPIPVVSSEAKESPVEDPVVYVWIPSSGFKYHSNAGCSNMDNPQKVTLDEAKAMGYTA